jgi:hypothetical protein
LEGIDTFLQSSEIKLENTFISDNEEVKGRKEYEEK